MNDKIEYSQILGPLSLSYHTKGNKQIYIFGEFHKPYPDNLLYCNGKGLRIADFIKQLASKTDIMIDLFLEKYIHFFKDKSAYSDLEEFDKKHGQYREEKYPDDITTIEPFEENDVNNADVNEPIDDNIDKIVLEEDGKYENNDIYKLRSLPNFNLLRNHRIDLRATSDLPAFFYEKPTQNINDWKTYTDDVIDYIHKRVKTFSKRIQNIYDDKNITFAKVLKQIRSIKDVQQFDILIKKYYDTIDIQCILEEKLLDSELKLAELTIEDMFASELSELYNLYDEMQTESLSQESLKTIIKHLNIIFKKIPEYDIEIPNTTTNIELVSKGCRILFDYVDIQKSNEYTFPFDYKGIILKHFKTYNVFMYFLRQEIGEQDFLDYIKPNSFLTLCDTMCYIWKKIRKLDLVDKLADTLVIQIFSDFIGLLPEINILYSSPVIEIYSIARMLRTFKDGTYPENIIFYGGDSHANEIRIILDEMNFTHKKFKTNLSRLKDGRYNEFAPRCIDISEYKYYHQFFKNSK